MEFELHGVKFKYEDEKMYRWKELKKGNAWKNLKLYNTKRGYLHFDFRCDNTRYTYKLHRIVYWLHNPEWDIFDTSIYNNSIDHIDRNRLNNNIENLRVVTNQGNSFNKSNVKGYYWSKEHKKWVGQICLNRKIIFLGYFELEEDARQAYLDAKEKYHII